MKERSKKCPNCNKKFTNKEIKNFNSRRFCTNTRRQEYDKKRMISRETLTKKYIPSGTTGASNELIVCADLLCRGKGVFRSLSPNCHCDVIWMDESGKLLKVEITTGKRNQNQSISFPPKDCNKSDLLAIVVPENQEIFYFDTKENLPEKPIAFEIPDSLIEKEI